MIDKISYSPINIMSSIQPKDNAGEGADDLGKKFGSFLNDAMSNLNAQQKQVDQLN